MRKLVTALILIPLGIVLLAFAVTNRQRVTISFDPFDPTHPAFTIRLPLFILIFTLVAVGVIVGSAVTWLKQRKWRARARRAEAELRALRSGTVLRGPERPPSAQPRNPLILPPAA